jgi:TonB-dependent receptor
VDLSRAFQLQIPVAVKLGGAINRQRTDSRTTTASWTFSPPGGADARLAKNWDVFATDFSARKSWTDASGGDLRVQWLDPTKFHQLYEQHPEYFVFDAVTNYRNEVLNSTYLEEIISAGYFRTDLKFFQNRLSLISGVRYEKTDDDGWGPLNDIRATFVQDANGNLARDAAGNFIRVAGDTATRDRLQYKDRGSHASKSYSGYYPSVNANFAIMENLVVRAAYARTIGRPALAEIIPGVTITDPTSTSTNKTITIVNTGLKPWTSDSYDLSLELYHWKGADASVGVFRKDITNFFGQTRVPATRELLAEFGLDEEPLDYDLITKSNFGNATINGLEWSYRQSLLFLPSWARGFQVFINLTRLNLSGANADDFSGFSPRNVNWGVTFARPRFVAKFNVAQHQGVRLARVNASAAEVAGSYQWEAPKTTIDVSAEYRFTKRLALYVGARNIGLTPKQSSTYGPGVPDYVTLRVMQHYGSLYTFGVKGEF